MGSYYAEPLTVEQHKKWSKEVNIFLLENELTKKDLADQIGYSYKAVVDSLSQYERCSRFIVAAVNEVRQKYEKRNSYNGGDSNDYIL